MDVFDYLMAGDQVGNIELQGKTIEEKVIELNEMFAKQKENVIPLPDNINSAEEFIDWVRKTNES